MSMLAADIMNNDDENGAVRDTFNIWRLEPQGSDDDGQDPPLLPPLGHIAGTSPPHLFSRSAGSHFSETMSSEMMQGESLRTEEAVDDGHHFPLLDSMHFALDEDHEMISNRPVQNNGRDYQDSNSARAVVNITAQQIISSSIVASAGHHSSDSDSSGSRMAESALELKSEAKNDRPMKTSSLKPYSPGRDSWDEKFERLKEYKARNSSTDVPQKEYPLGTWVNKQRMEKKKLDQGKTTSMTKERQLRLESIGFKWARPKGKASWEKHFQELVEYKNKNGDCNVPTKYEENKALGRWVTSQRADKKGGKIDKKYERRLNAIGFVWNRYEK